MEEIINQMERINIGEDYKIIENDLKQLSYIFYKGDIEYLDLPVLEYDYPYYYLEPRFYNILLSSLCDYMKEYDCWFNINDAHTLLEYYLGVAKNTN